MVAHGFTRREQRETVFTESLRDRWSDFPFLDGKVELNEPELETGSVGRGRLILLNAGSRLIDLQTESFVRAKVLYGSNLEWAASFTAPALGTGLHVRLNTSDEAAIAVIFTTESQRDGEKKALPPGDYVVEVNLPIFERQPGGDGYERSYLAMPLAPLRLIEKEKQ
jgi:hypothetical protein